MSGDYFSRVPWSTEESLKEKTRLAGVDFDAFIAALAARRSDVEMAREFGVPAQVVENLRRHFERYGVHSVVGQD